MTGAELKRWLSRHGVKFENAGKGSHQKAYLGNLTTVVPNHPSKEIGTGLVKKIKKDLGLK